MHRLPRLTDEAAEKRLLQAGFKLIRSKGSHGIEIETQRRIILPVRSGKMLHPKIVSQVLRALEEQS